MAQIIDFTAEVERRFYEWAAQYVDPKNGGDLSRIDIYAIILFLMKNNVFTAEEIRYELDKRKIPLHERHFESAMIRFEMEKQK